MQSLQGGEKPFKGTVEGSSQVTSERASQISQMRGAYGYRQVAESEKQDMVDSVFHRVARRYDLMNDLMSAGLHRAWKDAMVAKAAPPTRPGGNWRAIDVAGGTGDIAFRLADLAPQDATITVCDINTSMLEVGRQRASKRNFRCCVDFVEGNAESLPFEDDTFDLYTIAFGIRNVPDIATALREAHRVLKFGGKFICLEFSAVSVPMIDQLYDSWSVNVIPLVGQFIAGDREPYDYLVESIRRFPDQRRFSTAIEAAGFSRVSHVDFSGGVAALHWGWKL